MSARPSDAAPIYVSSYYYIRVLILPYMCPHTIIYVSSYYYSCVLVANEPPDAAPAGPPAHARSEFARSELLKASYTSSFRPHTLVA